MSNLNLQWIQENFTDPGMVLLNIGSADITDDSLRFSVALPYAKIYSFECSDHWKKSNLEKATHYKLNYEHKAVSYFDGFTTFFEGSVEASSHWRYRGQLTDPKLTNDSTLQNNGKTVEVISLNTWCKQKDISPTFLHIDVEGEEYNILKNLNDEYFPDAIWLEYKDSYRDHEQNFVDFSTLDNLLCDKKYTRIYKRYNDVLYVKKTKKVTEYVEYCHDTSFNPTTPHEILIQQKIWLLRYNLIKDSTWPILTHPREYFDLPTVIQQECDTIFNLTPIKQIC
jgi:FkbM family methyltransferase